MFLLFYVYEWCYMETSEFDTLVMERRSIRGYKKKPVPKELIAEIIAVAKGAPFINEHPTMVFPCGYR